jgi:hypothetical protein
MNTALRRELEQLFQETNTLLACPDFDFPTWEAYGVRRAAIFDRLQGLTFPTEGEEYEALSALIHDILAQDAIVIQKAQTRLAFLGAELASLATSRRALKGYACLPSPALFQRHI